MSGLPALPSFLREFEREPVPPDPLETEILEAWPSATEIERAELLSLLRNRKPTDLPILFPLQQTIYDHPARFKVLACGRRFGKTTAAKNDVITEALNGWPTFWMAPGEKTMGPDINDVEARVAPLIASFNRNDGLLRLTTGGSIEFITVGDKRRPIARGRKYKTGAIDEAAFIPGLEEVFEGNLRPALTDFKGRCWILSTPRGKNYFHRLFVLGGSGGKHAPTDPEWFSWRAPQAANPYLPRDEVERNAARTDPISQQEFHAEFVAAGTSPFEDDAIEDCLRIGPSDKPVAVWGIDLASRVDFTACVGLDDDGRLAGETVAGEKRAAVRTFQGSWASIKARVLEIIGDKPALMDSTGVGSPIFEELKLKKPRLAEFVFNSTSRQAILEEMRLAVNERLTGITEDIAKELRVFGIEYAANGTMRYASDETEHDDLVLAFALARWHWKNKQTPNVQAVAKSAPIDPAKITPEERKRLADEHRREVLRNMRPR